MTNVDSKLFFLHLLALWGIVRQNDGLGFTFGLPTIHLMQDAIVRKNIRIKIVLILTRTPAGPNPITHKAGLLTYSLYRAFPTGWAVSGKECDRIYSLIFEMSGQHLFVDALWPTGNGTYSSRYCFGFSPNFLFTPRPSRRLSENLTRTKVGKII